MGELHLDLDHLFGKRVAKEVRTEVTAALASRHDLLAFLGAAYHAAQDAAKEAIVVTVASSGGIVFSVANGGKLPTLAEFLAPLADVEKLLLADLKEAVALLVKPATAPAPEAAVTP